MFRFLTRERSKTVADKLRRSRPMIEMLESRDCPSGAPTLSLTAITNPGHLVELKGRVQDENGVPSTVTFTGAVQASTRTDSQGRYDFWTSSALLGTVTAVALDDLNVLSNAASATIAIPSSSLNLAISYGANRNVTVSGKLTDIDAGGRTVSFSGPISGSVVTSSDGTFSITRQASSTGSIQVTTVDLWGVSTVSAIAVTNQAPQIVNFQVVAGPNGMFTFSGTVIDESPGGLVVSLGGLNSIQGETVVVNDQGNFSITIYLPPGESGTATAQTVDWWGVSSNTAMTPVFND